MKLPLCFFPMALALCAQQLPVQPAFPGSNQQQSTKPETKPEDLCTLDGQVTNNATGAPVGKTEITLMGTDRPKAGTMPGNYSAVSDPGGNFVISGIEPGRYRLSASRTGFVRLEYGARGPMRGGTLLSLSTGQRMKDLSLRLTPQAVITGKVVDENNDPVVSASVQAQRYSYIEGKKQLIPMGSAMTNDLGEYRLHGLAPGRYYLSAKPTDDEWESTVDASATPEAEGYIITYYPGTANSTMAVQLEVTSGAQLRGTNITLAKGRTFRIRGHVEGRNDVQISLFPRGQTRYMSMGQDHSSDQKGNFEIRDVLPGAYTITAVAWADRSTLSATQDVDVSDSNIDNLVLVLDAGLELQGRIVAEGTGTPNLDSVQVFLNPRDTNRVNYYGGGSGTVKDGVFKLPNTQPAQYDLQIWNLPDGYWLKSLRMGDQEVKDAGMDLTHGPGAPITVTIAPNAGQIDGVVMNEQQQPAPGATVVLVPEPKLRDRRTAYKTATSDQNGRFNLKSLDPGEYKLFAWEDIEYGAYMDPDFLQPVEDRGQSITIQEGSRESVQLTRIPGDAAPSGRRDK
ncbi:MAG: carboxypeptidase-like regulatory domain-containing protein [Bryobacteraceae bacterium]